MNLQNQINLVLQWMNANKVSKAERIEISENNTVRVFAVGPVYYTIYSIWDVEQVAAYSDEYLAELLNEGGDAAIQALASVLEDSDPYFGNDEN